MQTSRLLYICVLSILNIALSYYQKYGNLSRIKQLTLLAKKKNQMSFLPRTANQKLYLDHLKNPDIKILFSIGPAGTGKTFLACNEAISLLKSELIQKIILTRPVVPVEEDIGFLPGSLVKKMDPWTRPILDIFEEKFSKQEIDNLIKNNVIEISPLGYMRGRTFKNAFIIADEMQNSSPNQMLMLTTRIGENSKMIITGDLKQTDKPCKSGLLDFTTRFYRFRDNYINTNNITITNYYGHFIKEVGIQIMEFDNKDIQRHAVVSKILEIYDNDNINTKYIKRDLFKPETLKFSSNATPYLEEMVSSIKIGNPLEIQVNNQTYANRKFSMTANPNDAALIPKHLYIPLSM